MKDSKENNIQKESNNNENEAIKEVNSAIQASRANDEYSDSVIRISRANDEYSDSTIQVSKANDEYYMEEINTDLNNDNGEYMDDALDRHPDGNYIPTSSDDESSEQQLKELLFYKKSIELQEENERVEKELLIKQQEQHKEDCKNNINIFSNWMEDKINMNLMSDKMDKNNLYTLFKQQFDVKYRTDLFENICEYFNDLSFVTDDILFYWKYIAICLLKSSKKYKYYLGDLVFETYIKETNFRLVKEKYIFRCFIGDESLCYFKENGNDYYVS